MFKLISICFKQDYLVFIYSEPINAEFSLSLILSKCSKDFISSSNSNGTISIFNSFSYLKCRGIKNSACFGYINTRWTSPFFA